MLASASSARADDGAEGFAACIDEIASAAKAEGIPATLADEVLSRLEFQARVIELDRAQPEFQ